MVAKGWSNNATKALIGIWGESRVQQKLDSVTRNKIIYEEIAEKMSTQGYDFDWKQCRIKAKKLAQAYRKVKCLSNKVVV